MKAPSKATLFALICALVIYLGSYVLLSVQGIYEPWFIGLNGVKLYGWAPKGFVHDYKWNRVLMTVYYPLWSLDSKLWHRLGQDIDDKYPIDEVAPADIWKVYVAWGIFHKKI